jgi:prefoldin subunit 5
MATVEKRLEDLEEAIKHLQRNTAALAGVLQLDNRVKQLEQEVENLKRGLKSLTQA